MPFRPAPSGHGMRLSLPWSSNSFEILSEITHDGSMGRKVYLPTLYRKNQVNSLKGKYTIYTMDPGSMG